MSTNTEAGKGGSRARDKQKGSLFGFLGPGRAFWVIAIGAALAAIVVSLAVLSQVTATSTYYVLGAPVAARTQITPDMLVPVTVSEGGQPRNALDATAVSQTPTYAKANMAAGDVVSSSTAGPRTRIGDNIPENFVAASFTLTPENAVAGKVATGDYIDVIAQSGDDGVGATAKVALSHVYVLDVSVAPDQIGQAPEEDAAANAATVDPSAAADSAAEGAATRDGIPSLYTVALSQPDATKLAIIREMKLFVVLSPAKTESQVEAQTQQGDVFTPGGVADSSEGITPDGSSDKATDEATPKASATPSAE